ncbi:MAG: ion transporter [Crocinitomicaceae bacterium]
MGQENKNTDALRPWQKKLHVVIFEADTKAGKQFDWILLGAILLSILVVMLESVPEYAEAYGTWFTGIEWGLTILFSIEYMLRILSVKRPVTYILSFYGLVDLMSIVPTYLGLFFTGTHSLAIIRSLRLLRVFRILKLGKYISDGQNLIQALKNSRSKIIVFLGAILTSVTILGTIMYLIESPESGFTSIPRSIYWAIVTLTTVGYGDIAPATDLGQFISAIVMILGYAVIAVPTGIVTNELIQTKSKDKISTQVCESCSREGHDKDAIYCKFCGEKLNG